MPKPRGVARTVSEVLIILPALALAVTWVGIVVLGLLDRELVGRHRVEIRQILTMLLIACIVGFAVGAIGFVASRRRRPTE